ncbi:MAG: tetratricopeptide repeat protein [Acetobacterales bacterium]
MTDSPSSSQMPPCGPAGDERRVALDTLRSAGGLPDEQLDLGACALALAALDRPGVPLQRYRDHLDSLVADARAEAARLGADADDDPDAGAEVLKAVLCGKYRYVGDGLAYDDLQNANLIRVIDRRKGLPVALGILFLHAARGIGCLAAGLNFPGHFVLRLEGGGRRVIIDPFNGARKLEAHDLRDLLKTMSGNDAELDAPLVADAGNRQVLLRLQNNIKVRKMRLSQLEEALETIERMLMFAPAEADLWREAGIIDARLGNLQSAARRLERYMETATDERGRYRTSMLLQEIRNRLN